MEDYPQNHCIQRDADQDEMFNQNMVLLKDSLSRSIVSNISHVSRHPSDKSITPSQKSANRHLQQQNIANQLNQTQMRKLMQGLMYSELESPAEDCIYESSSQCSNVSVLKPRKYLKLKDQEEQKDPSESQNREPPKLLEPTMAQPPQPPQQFVGKNPNLSSSSGGSHHDSSIESSNGASAPVLHHTPKQRGRHSGIIKQVACLDGINTEEQHFKHPRPKKIATQMERSHGHGKPPPLKPDQYVRQLNNESNMSATSPTELGSLMKPGQQASSLANLQLNDMSNQKIFSTFGQNKQPNFHTSSNAPAKAPQQPSSFGPQNHALEEENDTGTPKSRRLRSSANTPKNKHKVKKQKRGVRSSSSVNNNSLSPVSQNHCQYPPAIPDPMWNNNGNFTTQAQHQPPQPESVFIHSLALSVQPQQISSSAHHIQRCGPQPMSNQNFQQFDQAMIQQQYQISGAHVMPHQAQTPTAIPNSHLEDETPKQQQQPPQQWRQDPNYTQASAQHLHQQQLTGQSLQQPQYSPQKLFYPVDQQQQSAGYQQVPPDAYRMNGGYQISPEQQWQNMKQEKEADPEKSNEFMFQNMVSPPPQGENQIQQMQMVLEAMTQLQQQQLVQKQHQLIAQQAQQAQQHALLQAQQQAQLKVQQLQSQLLNQEDPDDPINSFTDMINQSQMPAEQKMILLLQAKCMNNQQQQQQKQLEELKAQLKRQKQQSVSKKRYSHHLQVPPLDQGESGFLSQSSENRHGHEFFAQGIGTTQLNIPTQEPLQEDVQDDGLTPNFGSIKTEKRKSQQNSGMLVRCYQQHIKQLEDKVRNLEQQRFLKALQGSQHSNNYQSSSSVISQSDDQRLPGGINSIESSIKKSRQTVKGQENSFSLMIDEPAGSKDILAVFDKKFEKVKAHFSFGHFIEQKLDSQEEEFAEMEKQLEEGAAVEVSESNPMNTPNMIAQRRQRSSKEEKEWKAQSILESIAEVGDSKEVSISRGGMTNKLSNGVVDCHSQYLFSPMSTPMNRGSFSGGKAEGDRKQALLNPTNKSAEAREKHNSLGSINEHQESSEISSSDSSDSQNQSRQIARLKRSYVKKKHQQARKSSLFMVQSIQNLKRNSTGELNFAKKKRRRSKSNKHLITQKEVKEGQIQHFTTMRMPKQGKRKSALIVSKSKTRAIRDHFEQFKASLFDPSQNTPNLRRLRQKLGSQFLKNQANFLQLAESQIEVETKYRMKRTEFGPNTITDRERAEIHKFMNKIEKANDASKSNQFVVNQKMLQILHGNLSAKEDILETEREDKSDTISVVPSQLSDLGRNNTYITMKANRENRRLSMLSANNLGQYIQSPELKDKVTKYRRKSQLVDSRRRRSMLGQPAVNSSTYSSGGNNTTTQKKIPNIIIIKDGDSDIGNLSQVMEIFKGQLNKTNPKPYPKPVPSSRASSKNQRRSFNCGNSNMKPLERSGNFTQLVQKYSTGRNFPSKGFYNAGHSDIEKKQSNSSLGYSPKSPQRSQNAMENPGVNCIIMNKQGEIKDQYSIPFPISAHKSIDSFNSKSQGYESQINPNSAFSGSATPCSDDSKLRKFGSRNDDQESLEKKQRIPLQQVPEEKKSHSKEASVPSRSIEERKDDPRSGRSSDSGEIKKQITPKFVEGEMITDPKRLKDLAHNLDLENIPELNDHMRAISKRKRERVADFGSNTDNLSAMSQVE